MDKTCGKSDCRYREVCYQKEHRLGSALSPFCCSAASASTQRHRCRWTLGLCPQAIATAERTQAIPKHLLSAIALAESGRKHPTLDKRMPWPWTVMAEGQGRYLATKQAAIEEVRQLQAGGSPTSTLAACR